MGLAPHSLTHRAGLVLIGASTGGPRTLCTLFENLPALNAAFLVVQHLPKLIETSLVRSLQRHAAMPVDLVRDGASLVPGSVLLAPAGLHCTLDANHRLRLVAGPKVNYVCPSVDVTMGSVVAPTRGERLIGVLLTGMGEDGARGMVHLRQLGALTVAQDEASSAVFGMPKAAWNVGGTDLLLPPERIARQLTRWLSPLPDSLATPPSPPSPGRSPLFLADVERAVRRG